MGHVRLPVVNPDLLSPDPVIFSPPDSQHTFSSPAMAAVDRILSHMNNPDYDLRQYTDLEKLVHAAHMQEVWQEAGNVYSEIQASDGVDKDLCHCIQDVENNGIMRELLTVAHRLREAGDRNDKDDDIIDKEKETKMHESNSNVHGSISNLLLYSTNEKGQEGGKDVDSQNDHRLMSNFLIYNNINEEDDAESTANDNSHDLIISNFLIYNKDNEENVNKDEPSKSVHGSISNLLIYNNDDKVDEMPKGSSGKMAHGSFSNLLIYDDDASKKVHGSISNLLLYNNIDEHDRKEEIRSHAVKKDIDQKLTDGDNFEVLPHLRNSQDWAVWRSSIETMKPHMKEYSRYLAIYMHCMLQ